MPALYHTECTTPYAQHWKLDVQHWSVKNGGYTKQTLLFKKTKTIRRPIQQDNFYKYVHNAHICTLFLCVYISRECLILPSVYDVQKVSKDM